MLSTSDLAFIEKKGITAEMVDAQLKRFEVGFPFLKINAVATIGNGIKAFSPEETSGLLSVFVFFANHDNNVSSSEFLKWVLI